MAKVYSMQNYVIKLVTPGTPVSSTNKTTCYNIIEILLNVALNTRTQTKPSDVCNLSLYWISCLSPFGLRAPKVLICCFQSLNLLLQEILNYLIYQSFDSTWAYLMKVITGKGRVQIMRLHHNIILQKCHPEMYMHSIWKVTNKYIATIEANYEKTYNAWCKKKHSTERSQQEMHSRSS